MLGDSEGVVNKANPDAFFQFISLLQGQNLFIEIRFGTVHLRKELWKAQNFF